MIVGQSVRHHYKFFSIMKSVATDDICCSIKHEIEIATVPFWGCIVLRSQTSSIT